MSLAVVLLAPPASDTAAPFGAPTPPAPAAAVPPALPAADAAPRSGTLKSFTARYSSRILHAIFARWLRALPALQSQADAGAACVCTALQRRPLACKRPCGAAGCAPGFIRRGLLAMVCGEEVERALQRQQRERLHRLALDGQLLHSRWPRACGRLLSSGWRHLPCCVQRPKLHRRV